MSDAVETDQELGAAHPRDNYRLFGHEEAERALAEGLESGRLHHAWLLTGAKGVGKATLAYRFARRLLGAPAAGERLLDVDPQHPVVRRVAQLAHPDLFVVRRGIGDRGKARREILVDDVRAMNAFFAKKPAEGGWRIAIVDAVDELNRNAANAILKTLEEPPPRAALVLVCHAPGAALATIRSRCRRLALRALPDAAVNAALAEQGQTADDALLRLARGRPGRAISLAARKAPALMLDLEHALRAGGALPLAFQREGGDGAERLDLLLEVSREWLRRAVGAAAGAPLDDDRAAVKPAAVAAWSQAWQGLEELRSQADGLNMDPVHAQVRALAILSAAARRANA